MYHLLIFVFLLMSAPTSESTKKKIAQIDAQVMAIDSIKGHLNQNLKVFCRLPESPKIIAIVDTTRWPEEIETTFNVIFDSTGRVVEFVEIPRTYDSAWEVRYYYDEGGRLLRLQFHQTTPDAGQNCTAILREYIDEYFSGDGSILDSTCSFKDADYKPIDTAGCNLDRDTRIFVYRTTSDVKKLLGIVTSN
jgi:hypothetical protein